MDMFWHDRKGPEVEAVQMAGSVQRVDKELPRPIFAQELAILEARKSKFVGFSRRVIGFSRFPVWRRFHRRPKCRYILNL